ncbi:VirB4 family type IV secretion system protein [Bacillus sp. Au-Bac7]|uniref:VirB4 family type IV secretion system protein n=1 Tax=Bacillus sp. Au-Bac7 TaxID=2906458 RepID=UPI001E589C53|nr:ATPase [Bacillus sp. Au-Bac7]MCE4051674.1 ATPase [Bacillus sp. Au-Bac7]
MSLQQDFDFIKATQPMGGISFKDEYYNRKGDGYEACLHVYKYPNDFHEFWLKDLTSIENTIVTVDTYTDQSINYGEKVGHSAEEMNSRVRNAMKTTEMDNADYELNALRELAIALNKEGEVIKQIHVRIYVYAPTVEKLKESVFEIQKKLDSDGYKSTVFLEENKQQWQSLFLDYEKQRKLPNNRVGYELPAEVMGLGFAHDQTSLKDPTGGYYGYTRTYGPVYLDIFHKTTKRLYYNAFIGGDLGSGKSTLLKKLLKDNVAKGNFIRSFDKASEQDGIVEYFGGVVINLDGSGGRINLLQVFPTVSNGNKIDQNASFRQHVSKLNTSYRMLNRNCSDKEHQQFDDLIYDFYIELGLWDEKGTKNITDLPIDRYPILSEFHQYTIRRYEEEKDERFKGRIGDISKSIGALVNQYGDMFNGPTTIPNLVDQQIVVYDIGNLSQLKPEIFDIQIFNALTQIWGDMMLIGKREKEAFERGEKHWWDIIRLITILDECHNLLNINKAFAADFFVTFQSEARKFFSGLVLATQRIERMFPNANNVSNEQMVLAANKLSEVFGLTQYKFLFRQDKTSMPLIRKIFENQLTESEYNLIPNLETGDCVLSISGDQNLVMHVEVTKEELDMFLGGA